MECEKRLSTVMTGRELRNDREGGKTRRERIQGPTVAVVDGMPGKAGWPNR